MNPRRWFRKYYEEQVRSEVRARKGSLNTGRRYRLLPVLAASFYLLFLSSSILFSQPSGLPRTAVIAFQENWEQGAFVEYWSVSVSDWKK